MTANQSNSTRASRIEISEWITHQKHTLRGFFTATLPSGMIVRDLSLHTKDEDRWVNMPSRAWVDEKTGTTHHTAIIQFIDAETRDNFRDAVLAALDRYFEQISSRGKE